MRPVENYILNKDINASKENMAFYAVIVKDTGNGDKYTNTNTKVIHSVKK